MISEGRRRCWSRLLIATGHPGIRSWHRLSLCPRGLMHQAITARNILVGPSSLTAFGDPHPALLHAPPCSWGRASNGISVISLGDLLFHGRIAHWAFEGVALCRRSRSWSSLCNPFWKRDSGSRQGKGLGISHCQRQANNHGISKREFAHAPITGNNEALAARLGCPLVKW